MIYLIHHTWLHTLLRFLTRISVPVGTTHSFTPHSRGGGRAFNSSSQLYLRYEYSFFFEKKKTTTTLSSHTKDEKKKRQTPARSPSALLRVGTLNGEMPPPPPSQPVTFGGAAAADAGSDAFYEWATQRAGVEAIRCAPAEVSEGWRGVCATDAIAPGDCILRVPGMAETFTLNPHSHSHAHSHAHTDT